MAERITINPITRLEGHGKIEIFLDDKGDVDNAYFQVPELRGFEQFCIGRPVEEMPRITTRICGVCPMAHHMASTKALDDLFNVEPTPVARKIRELLYCVFMTEDHPLHFVYLGGPDFVVGPDAPAGDRNILGVIGKVGLETAGKIIDMRKRLRAIVTNVGGKIIHPVFGVPGGVSKGISEDERKEIVRVGKDAVEFAEFLLTVFDDVVLKNKAYVDLVTGDVYRHTTYYMGMVDDSDRINFYDGRIRVVSPEGLEIAKFEGKDYLDHVAEHVEPWSYVKFPYLKSVGWKGFADGAHSGVYRVAPLARLNASSGMATPLAQAEYEKMFDTLGEKPAHGTLAFHWARLVETLYAAERMLELAEDPGLTDPNVRRIPDAKPDRGIGVVEAPRGTLFHHYETDEKGILTGVNLIVATQNNAAAICMSVKKAASELIRGGNVSDGLLNMVEMAFRAYDPCFACATHTLPGQMPLVVNLYDKKKQLLRTIRRD